MSVNKRSVGQELAELYAKTKQQKPYQFEPDNLPLAATVSKLVAPREKRYNDRMSDPDSVTGQLSAGMDEISKSIMQRFIDNDNAFKLFPDLELAAQIVISSILSPKNMVDYDLIYKLKESDFPPHVGARLLEIVRPYINTEYGFKEELPELIKTALFKTGSYVKLVLPESAVDFVINQGAKITTESISNTDLFDSPKSGIPAFSVVKNKGLLGNSSKESQKKNIFAVESLINLDPPSNYDPKLLVAEKIKDKLTDEKVFDAEKVTKLVTEHIEIIDNFDLLKFPKLLEKINAQRVADITSTNLRTNSQRFIDESIDNETKKNTPNKKELANMVYKKSPYSYRPFVSIPTSYNLKRRSVGKPYIALLPSESVIPLYAPGDPKNHIGYIVLTEADGVPISVDTVSQETYGTAQGLSSLAKTSGNVNTSFSSLLTEKARQNLNADAFVPVIDGLAEIYADVIENDIMERFVKGAYGRKIQIARTNEVYRIMLARALQGNFTRMIYVPAEYVSYFAFDHHRNGVGKSYLDDMGNLISFRAMVLFSKVMSKIKSSIQTTVAHINFDPKDPDPIKTMEDAKFFIAKSRQQQFPNGLRNVSDMTDWAHRAGIMITYEGHPNLPSTRFEFETKNNEHPTPPDDLDEMLREQMYMHFGVNPEMVDSARGSDFAASVQENSILFSRRIFILSTLLSTMSSEHIKRLASFDVNLQEQLIEVIKENIGEFKNKEEKKDKEGKVDEDSGSPVEDDTGFASYILEKFIELIIVDFPKPDTTKKKELKEGFDLHEQLLDSALKYIIGPDVLNSEFAGELSGKSDALLAAYKALLMREWMSQENFLPEIFNITSVDSSGKPNYQILEMVKNYTETMMQNIQTFLKAIKPSAIASDKDLEALGNSGSSSSFEPESPPDEGSGSDPFGGGDNPFEELAGGSNPDDTGTNDDPENPSEDLGSAAENKFGNLG